MIYKDAAVALRDAIKPSPGVRVQADFVIISRSIAISVNVSDYTSEYGISDCEFPFVKIKNTFFKMRFVCSMVILTFLSEIFCEKGKRSPFTLRVTSVKKIIKFLLF